jgi:hypothetical protein
LWKYVEKVILYFNALYIDVIVIQNIIINKKQILQIF